MSNPIQIDTDNQIIQRHDLSVRRRAKTELAVVHRVIKDLIAAGYRLEINDGDDDGTTGDEQTLVTVAFGVDESILYAAKDGHTTYVKFVMGNDGWDVVCDYGTSLSPIMEPIEEWVDKEMEAGRM